MLKTNQQTPECLSLIIAAWSFAVGAETTKKHHLRKAIEAAQGTGDWRPDPEILVEKYIEGGGSWQELVALVNKNALKGATHRNSHQQGDER